MCNTVLIDLQIIIRNMFAACSNEIVWNSFIGPREECHNQTNGDWSVGSVLIGGERDKPKVFEPGNVVPIDQIGFTVLTWH